MNRLLVRSFRPAVICRNKTTEVPDLSNVLKEVQLGEDFVPPGISQQDFRGEMDLSFLDSIDISQLNVVQELFFNSYSLVADMSGISPIMAIPASILLGRLLLFPFYLWNRRTMPRYITATMELQYNSMKMQLDQASGKFVDPEEIKNKLLQSRNKIIKNFPIWGIPIGLFTTGNLYATWAIAPSASTLNYMIPMLDTNLFHCSIPLAFLASGAQYAALKSGAEMGKLSLDKSETEKQAGNVVNKLFGFLIGMTIPLQIYFNVPAYVSLMWVFNTSITFAFSKIITSNPSLFKINEQESQNERAFYQEKITKIIEEMKEKQKIAKEHDNIMKSIPDEVIEERLQSLKRLEEMKEKVDNLEKRRSRLRENEEIAKKSKQIRRKLKNKSFGVDSKGNKD